MEIFSIILLFTVAFVGFYIAKALMKVNKIAKKITTSSTPWPEQVKAEKLHKFQFKLLGYQLFEHKLVTFIDDLKLSTEEIQELDKLINFFNLNPYRIGAIKAKYNKSAIEKLSKIALSDNVITDKERSAMFQLAESLNLPAATVDKINRTNALKILMSAREDALSDSRLTEKEENQLLELTDKLGLSEDDLLGSMPEQRSFHYPTT
jgi:hypothetical protein